MFLFFPYKADVWFQLFFFANDMPYAFEWLSLPPPPLNIHNAVDTHTHMHAHTAFLV